MKKSIRFTALIVAVIMLVAVLASCADDTPGFVRNTTSSTTTTTTTTTKTTTTTNSTSTSSKTEPKPDVSSSSSTSMTDPTPDQPTPDTSSSTSTSITDPTPNQPTPDTSSSTSSSTTDPTPDQPTPDTSSSTSSSTTDPTPDDPTPDKPTTTKPVMTEPSPLPDSEDPFDIALNNTLKSEGFVVDQVLDIDTKNTPIGEKDYYNKDTHSESTTIYNKGNISIDFMQTEAGKLALDIDTVYMYNGLYYEACGVRNNTATGGLYYGHMIGQQEDIPSSAALVHALSLITKFKTEDFNSVVVTENEGVTTYTCTELKSDMVKEYLGKYGMPRAYYNEDAKLVFTVKDGNLQTVKFDISVRDRLSEESSAEEIKISEQFTITYEERDVLPPADWDVSKATEQIWYVFLPLFKG